MNASDLIFVTADYKVVALRKEDGQEAWATTLISSFFKPLTPFVTLMVDGSGVYAHTNNQLFRLDLLTGKILWRQDLAAGKWLKSQGIASIAGVASKSDVAVAAKASSQRQRGGDGAAD